MRSSTADSTASAVSTPLMVGPGGWFASSFTAVPFDPGSEPAGIVFGELPGGADAETPSGWASADWAQSIDPIIHQACVLKLHPILVLNRGSRGAASQARKTVDIFERMPEGFS